MVNGFTVSPWLRLDGTEGERGAGRCRGERGENQRARRRKGLTRRREGRGVKVVKLAALFEGRRGFSGEVAGDAAGGLPLGSVR